MLPGIVFSNSSMTFSSFNSGAKRFSPAAIISGGKMFSSFLNLSLRVRLTYLKIMVYWLIYHKGLNYPVFSNDNYLLQF